MRHMERFEIEVFTGGYAENLIIATGCGIHQAR